AFGIASSPTDFASIRPASKEPLSGANARLLPPRFLSSPLCSPMQFLWPATLGRRITKTAWRNKKMKIEQAKQLTEQALDQLIQALEAGKSETLRAYLSMMSRFHSYSLANLMLIAFQRPCATRVAGFQTWKSLGRFVKKGERGI